MHPDRPPVTPGGVLSASSRELLMEQELLKRF